ncbi:bifunctional diguanylate cyclase/phosphodiesterase [Pseudobutyrivibrio xylanivorans]|uniref:Bifunctional diguanylate cyclase/phosphodiesterase n=1 Tax=Pseudobutyrivibrio xylanivorans TaxID=185007 RepID=A0A5P6VU39_PSEXY|nr:bifunctional diguanylate cyclase/phosphodiesterase [Pseudobutyrivibrio xylanivorans]QFJ54361.1 bifunctional diguanylate cyclase/phosphodiesterase [Pseudobutyrivibrio xylanivorans]
MDSSSRISYELVNYSEDIQQVQDAFCKEGDMYVICMSKTNGQITSFSGEKSEEDFVDANFSSEIKNKLLESFVDGSPENVVEVAAPEDYFMYRAVAIRGDEGKVIGAWLCFGIDRGSIPAGTSLPEKVSTTTVVQFDKAVALMETVSKCYFKEKLYSHKLKARLSDEKNAGLIAEDKLKKNEIMTAILRLMESDDSFMKVSGEILKEAGLYVGCTNTGLIQLSTDGTTADMIIEWSSQEKRLSETFKGIPVEELPFMNGKPYTISSDASLPKSFEDFFGKFDIKAAILLPLNVNESEAMYLCFVSIGQERQWSVEDIRFANDIKHILYNILVKKITANSLASSYSALTAILQNAGYGVVVADVENRQILYTNDTFNTLFENEIDRVAVQELIFDKRYEISVLNGYSANGSGKWFDISLHNIKWVDEREVRLITFYDTTEIRSYQKKAEKQAQEDSLTGLFNRQACEKDISIEYHVAKKLGKEFAVLMFDLDNFSHVNEGLGYQAGDDLLEFIAHSINDISAISGKCYRVGGDEFAVLVDHEHFDSLDLVIKRIMNLFDNPWTIKDQQYYCTISMGGVKAPADITDASAILTRLTIALHGVKDRGKNSFEFYNEKSDVVMAEKLKLEQALRRAVEKGCREFSVYYQPIMEFIGGVPNCCGAEALVRWNSSELGLMMPDSFIYEAERLRLIGDIGDHVLYEAAKTCKHWNDFGHPEYKVNVNISVVQLLQKDFVDRVDKVLKATAIEPKNLTLEITESIEVTEMDNVVNTLFKIRNLGVRVALDDFGTGFSSLNHIQKLPINTIKIGRSFVSDIDTNDFSKAFVKTISDLADSLHMDICVEGVEDSKHVDLLGDYAVNLAQGFFFDKPLTKEEFGEKYI